ncbi:MAG: CotH kinase family protein [Rhodoferax sp.]|nr:CotH kinase family protein [Rhodoferax sp.]
MTTTNTVFISVALSCLLMACGGGAGDGAGGGTSTGQPNVFSQPHPAATGSGPLAGITVPSTSKAAAVRTPDASSFLNWAESAYPNYFPTSESNKSIDVWTYRYYPKTDIYLGTNTTGDVLGLVGTGGGAYNSVPLGKIGDYGCAVFPSDCVATSPVLAAVEADATRDNPSTYAVELDRVIDASVVTFDGTYTFADVNGDIDDTDSLVPEVDAHLILDGYPEDGLAKNAKLRLRGHSSRWADQKSYRIKLASTVPLWRNESTVQLNKHPYDLTRMRNKLAFDLFREIPHIASLRTQFVHMTMVNKNQAGVQYASSDYGLFTHVEKMGKEYLANRGLPTDGNVYKAEDFEFKPDARLAIDADGKVVDKTKFEQMLSLEADNKNHKPLLAMIADVNNDSIPFDTTFAKYFDKSNYLTWLATNILFGNRDTVNQNFGLYQAKGSDKFYFVPWDYDGAFGFEDQPIQAKEGPLYAPWQKSIANWWNSPLHKRFLQDPAHLAELGRAIDEIYSAYLSDEKVKVKLDRYKSLVSPWIAKVPDSTFLPVLSSSPASEWDAETARILTAIKANRNAFAGGLESPMPYWQSADMEDGQIRLSWDAAIDLQGDAVTYTVQVSTSPSFSTVLQQTEVSGSTSLLIPKMVNGKFYLKVTAKDSKGNVQNAFDRVDVSGAAPYFGVSAYTVTDTAVTPSF